MQYGASLEDVERFDITDLHLFTSQRIKSEERVFKMLRDLFRWHAMMILKGFSKEGIKEKDWLFADEKKIQKKQNPLSDPKIKEWVKNMDAKMKKANE